MAGQAHLHAPFGQGVVDLNDGHAGHALSHFLLVAEVFETLLFVSSVAELGLPFLGGEAVERRRRRA